MYLFAASSFPKGTLPFSNQPVATGPVLTGMPVVTQATTMPYHGVPKPSAPGAPPVAQTGAAATKPKTLLIKEQPLLIQDLLDEEKKEQERLRWLNRPTSRSFSFLLWIYFSEKRWKICKACDCP